MSTCETVTFCSVEMRRGRGICEEVKPLVEQFLGERGLELSVEKTRITPITDGLDFLGQHVRKYHGKLLIMPSKPNIKAFLDDVRQVIKRNAQVATPVLIGQLNPKIRGWANFHRHVASKRAFRHVDNAIFHALWSWAVRRHPKKSRHWVKEKYFGTRGNQHWAFFGPGTNGKGQPVTYWLFHAASVPIRRHVKIKGAANPYDPVWADYFAQRHHAREAARLTEKVRAGAHEQGAEHRSRSTVVKPRPHAGRSKGSSRVR